MTKDKTKDLFDDQRAGRIYRAAAQMIYEKGFDATSMNEIAEACNLTKPGLYYYVKGKKELLYTIMSFALDRLEVEVVEPAKLVDDPEQRLRHIMREHARLLTRETNAPGILIDEVRGLSSEQREVITARKRDYLDFIRDTLEALGREGKLRSVDTTTAAFSLLGMVMWLSRWFTSGGRLSSEEVARDVADMAVSGVLESTASKPTATLLA